MFCIKTVLLIAAALQTILIINGQHQANCSSYFDDYFMPTAKLALNKIQQSFAHQTNATTSSISLAQVASAVNSNLSDLLPVTANPSSEIRVTTQSQNVETKQREKFQTEVPNKNDFIKLETVPTINSQTAASIEVKSDAVEFANEASSSSSEQPAFEVVSSTLATDTDPTSTLVSTSTDSSNDVQQANKAVLPVETKSSADQVSLVTVDLPSEQVTSNVNGEVTTTTVASITSGQAEPKQPTESKSAEDSIRETELEAQAAVDASIGFGDLFSSLADPCYDEYGNARYCEPEFENAAFEKQVEVSSECGTPPSRFCTAHLNERNDQIRNCHICDAQHPKKRHPTSFLTDMNNSNNPTCWVSAPISSPQQSPTSQQPQTNGTSMGGGVELAATNAPLRSDNVTLVLNLDKKYEIVYISLQFCSTKPDSLAIYKSTDNGRSWLPYQFYSSQCPRMYGRQATSLTSSSKSIERSEALCSNGSGQSASSGGSNSGSRIAFSPLDGRKGGHNLDKSIALQDWTTATSIKIVLERHQTSWIQSNMVHAHHGQINNRSNSDANNNEQQNSLENSLINPSDTFNYAISDLTVGGRCKCNGHASRCIHGKEGRLECDCRHNTAGRDCEKCAPFHFDRPWMRATQMDANPCQPCNCNGHSRKCRFDSELYRLSGKRSGGVCIGCRDNTAGRHCHYCREGFTRDHSRPMSDKEACKHCDCHPIGSLGKVCNQTSGQCPCKEGVTGLQCNLCASGYQQSSSLSEPCIKLPENDINYEPPALSADEQSTSSTGNSEPPLGEMPQIASNNEPLAPSGEQQQNNNKTPSGGSQRNSNNNNRTPPNEADELDPLASGGQDLMDKMEDQGSDAEDQAGLANPNKRLWLAGQSNVAGRKRHKTYYKYNMANHHRSRNHLQDNDQADPSSESDEIDEYLTSRGRQGGRTSSMDPLDEYSPLDPHVYMQQGYANNYGYRRRTTRPNRPRQNEIMLQPVASLDHPDDSLPDEQSVEPFGYSSSSMYNEDNFNQIQGALNSAGRRVPHQQVAGRGRQGLNTATTRHRFEPQFNADPQPNNELICGECQTATRRLGFRQFCHLDYAVKVNVLNKYVAEDWTRFDMEIQDIFRSPSSTSGARDQVGNFLDNSVGQPETELSSELSGGRNVNKTEERQVAPISQVNRLKIGTVQSVWVPTEDLTCRCPRIKLRATYLLMGSVDDKENSANSLQLDRHGVALEWKSSLQEKLIKYQRRRSRGRC